MLRRAFIRCSVMSLGLLGLVGVKAAERKTEAPGYLIEEDNLCLHIKFTRENWQRVPVMYDASGRQLKEKEVLEKLIEETKMQMKEKGLTKLTTDCPW